MNVATHSDACDAVTQAGDRLREGLLDRPELDRLCRDLIAASTHSKWEVRRAVARAVLHAPDGTFDELIAPLRNDRSRHVREAARRTGELRAEEREMDLTARQRSEKLKAWLDEIAEDGTRSTAAKALRFSERHVELVVNELHHEMNDLLNALRLSTGRLRRYLEDDPLDRGRLTGQADTVRDAVASLCAVAEHFRADNTRIVLEARSTDVRSLVQRACKVVRASAGGRLSRRDIVIDIDRELTVEVDPHWMGCALRNLLKNAAQSLDGCGRAPKIQITTRPAARHLLALAISDNGAGMSAPALEACRELGWTSKRNGRGFGLALVRKIVEQAHQGRVEVESTEGKGTTVTLIVPRKQEAA